MRAVAETARAARRVRRPREPGGGVVLRSRAPTNSSSSGPRARPAARRRPERAHIDRRVGAAVRFFVSADEERRGNRREHARRSAGGRRTRRSTSNRIRTAALERHQDVAQVVASAAGPVANDAAPADDALDSLARSRVSRMRSSAPPANRGTRRTT